jgi:diguanylate cyclase (GGDEF)-like protein
VAVIAANLFVFGIIGIVLWESYEQEYDRAVVSLKDVSQEMDDELSRLIDKIDLTVHTIAYEAEHELKTGGIDRSFFEGLLAHQDSHLPEAIGIRVIDAQGRVAFAVHNVTNANPVVSDREYFFRHRAEPGLGLLISAPFAEQGSGAPTVTLSRRYNAPDGSFAGVVAEPIPIEKLSGILSSAGIIGQSGRASLWDNKLGLVAQYSGPSLRLSDSAKPSPGLADLIRTDSGATVYRNARAEFGGVDRVIFFRKVSRWPLYLSLGMAATDATAEWRQQRATLVTLGTMFMLASLGVFVLFSHNLDALQASEGRYRGLFEYMQVGFSLREMVPDASGQSVDFRFVAVNRAFLDIFSLTSDAVVGKTMRQVWPSIANDSTDWFGIFETVATTGKPAHFETFGESTQVWSDVVAYRTGPLQVAVLSSDITERKAAEAKAQRLSKLYAALNQCNQATVRCTSESELFSVVCRTAVEFGGMQAAWIGRIDDGTKQVIPLSSDGVDLATLRETHISVRGADPRGCGPTGTALRTNSPQWCQDVANDPSLLPWSDALKTIGCAAMAALPLQRRGLPIGNLTLYSGTVNAFDDEARNLLVEMAADVSFALDNLDRETERRQAEARIQELAFFDPLTGLPNRTLLLDRIRQAIAGSARSGSRCALLFIDLDNFKTLNDTFGHDKGDLLLQQTARRLSSAVRAEDTVARFGGDEFVLVVSGLAATEAEAAAAAEAIGVKILRALDAPHRLGEVSHRCTGSMGVTLFDREAESVENLVKQADMAMYRAKAAGRNTLRFFDPAMQATVIERMSLEADIDRALRYGQFTLHYQPQVVHGKGVVGAEALLRWQHPKRGTVSPAEFIPLAEETGQILALGDWVLETACSQLARWAHRPELAHLSVAVNVSARQFRESDFVGKVVETIRRTGAAPRVLKLELTESLLVVNVQDVIAKMNALKSGGTCFSLDDFGTGYSSLTYLKRLPLEQLKIDQSFVRDLLTDPSDAAIAKTIVALAQSLGLGVIAEGVETREQWEFLVGLGCRSCQGYLFSPALPLDEFESFVLDGKGCC